MATVDELKQKIAACGNDKKCIKDAQDAFVASGGTRGKPEGGKVFSDTTGGKVFVTDGGKVF
jgi:hypothetical protein